MKNYQKPEFIVVDAPVEGVYAASGAAGVDCLDVTWWEDHPDGDVYRFVFKISHKGHQSYGQTISAEFSVPITVVETDGLVTPTVTGNTLKLFRNNQLNDSGLVELWVKLRASTHPTVLSVTALECKRS